MGHALVKKRMEKGLKLYNEQRYDEAIKRWKYCAYRMKNNPSKFVVYSYLALACLDRGKFRDYSTYAIQELSVANSLEDDSLRCEAYLTLARANEIISEYFKAVSYCRTSLKYNPKREIVRGYIYLTMGDAYYGLSTFERTIECWCNALHISRNYDDLILELQVFNNLGKLYMDLKDYDHAFTLFNRAMHFAQKFTSKNDNTYKFVRITKSKYVAILRKFGRLQEAITLVREVIKESIYYGDRKTQAKALFQHANILRDKGSTMEAVALFKLSRNLLIDIGDRQNQALVTLAMAKTKHAADEVTIREQAIRDLSESLDLASLMGNKMIQMRCHKLYGQIFYSNGDSEKVKIHAAEATRLMDEMDLICKVCQHFYGDVPELLEILPCSHIFHARCVKDIILKSQSIPQCCPKCKNNFIFNEGILPLKNNDFTAPYMSSSCLFSSPNRISVASTCSLRLQNL